MSRIVCLGAALQDIYLIDKKDFQSLGNLELDAKVDVEKIAYHIGGGGTNAAVTFARHGHETVLMTNIAHDVCGESILALLDQENIDSSYVHFSSHHQTGCSVILLDENKGERVILTHRGASAHYKDLEAKDLELIHPDWLYVTTTGGDFEILNQFCDQARKIGAKVMFNPGCAELEHPKKLIQLLSKIDVLLVNKAEAAQIVHGELLEELVERLQRYVPVVIVTNNVMGGIACDGENVARFGLYEDTKVVDTTGAGDAFGAGFLAHYTDGHDFQESLMFASANATSVISHLGAQDGILTGDKDLHPMPLQSFKMSVL